MLRYERAPDLHQKISELVGLLGLDYIDPEGLICLRSHGSKSGAVAWCHGLPGVWQAALGAKKRYVIEVVSETFDPLSEEEKTKTLVHELMHIPSTFSGGLRPHKPYQFTRRVNEMVRRLAKIETERPKGKTQPPPRKAQHRSQA
jgi:predicted metallopeptidase